MFALPDLDSVRRLHALTTNPGWQAASKPLLDQPDIERARVDAFVAAAAPLVPHTRRLLVSPDAPLYVGKTETEPRLALFDHVEVNKTWAIDVKKLPRMLADPHASGVVSLRLEDPKCAAVLLAGLDAATTPMFTRMELHPSTAPPVLADLLAHPKLARLESLTIAGYNAAVGDERCAIISRMPQVATLKHLHVNGLDKLTAASWTALARAPFTALRSVRLGASTWIPRGTVRHVLFEAAWLGDLRVLGLDSLEEAELDLLLAKVPFGQLVALDLQFRAGNTPARPDLGDSVIPHLRACQMLSLTHTTEAAVPALVASGLLPEMEALYIERSRDPALLAAGLVTHVNPGDLTARRHQDEAGFVWKY